MLAFEVSVNGKRQYVAGHPDGQTLHLTLFGGNNFQPAASINTFVAVPNNSPGGLATLSYPGRPLAVGDELTIRIVDAATADAPLERNDGERNARDGSYQIEFGVSE
jgi:hypothetical protein